MKPELVKKALEKVGDPNLLVNVVSRRVRQLTSAGGTGSRPLIPEAANMGTADLALTELVEDKLTFKLVEEEGDADDPAARKRRKPA